LLSGTPALSRPSELFTQLNALDPFLFGHFHEFGVRYCGGRGERFGWVYDGATHLMELHLLLENSVMIRRLKKQVLDQLPPKQRQQVILSVSKAHANIIKNILKEYSNTKRLLSGGKIKFFCFFFFFPSALLSDFCKLEIKQLKTRKQQMKSRVRGKD
jgi:SWI/SNF-related matrix-associated actin-dependent regulator 1 of chromatin subfamily A